MYNKNCKCPFCNMDKTKLVNTILEETKYFYIVPSLGAIVDGYLLVISKRHNNSMSELNVEEMIEFKQLLEKYKNVFKNVYKKHPIIFEHGTPNLKYDIKANSILHAHAHIVNHKYNNEKILIENLKFRKINDLENLTSNTNYIFYINSNNDIYLTNHFPSISQIMRIEIARDLNLLDKYDWNKNIFLKILF